jgi:hypothetical protein
LLLGLFFAWALGWVGAFGSTPVLAILPPPQSELPSADLQVPPDRLYFGEVWETNQFAWVLPIENRGSHAITITGFSFSCACSKITPDSLSIPAGQTREVRLTIDLRAKQLKGDQRPTRGFEVAISPRLSPQDAKPIQWVIKGNVRVPLLLESEVLDLGRCSVFAEPLPKRTMSITSTVPLADLSVRGLPADFAATVAQQPDSKSKYTLTVTTVKKRPPGLHQFQLELIPKLSSGEQLPAQKLPVELRLVSDIQASPPDVTFGAKALGETAVDTITLQSLTHRQFKVTTVQAKGEGLDCCQETTGNLKAVFRITQRILKVGAQHGQVVFRLSSTENQQETVEVGVFYQGIPASGQQP